MLAWVVALAVGMAGMAAAAAQAPPSPPLVLEATVPLGPVNGRIDHLAVDTIRRRLFVAELGNDSLGVVDLVRQKLEKTIAGFSEPQGVGYDPVTDAIYVANGGDGSVRVLSGETLSAIGRIGLGSDADNVRIDLARRRVLVGYGDGAIAVIDPAKRAKTAEYRLRGHPEGFQVTPDGTQIVANVPGRAEIAVIGRAGAATRSVATGGLRGNYPMAVDVRSDRILVAFRNPPTLAALIGPDWGFVETMGTCGDADDISSDPGRARLYVSCGEGVVDVFSESAGGYGRIARIPTARGARTSLFVPDLDRLFVAVRATREQPAAIWVFRPVQ